MQCFLGVANFYHRFSKLILPHTQLTKKDQSFVWTTNADNALLDLKTTFTSAPILAHVDPQKTFIIEADASDFSFGSICHKKVVE